MGPAVTAHGVEKRFGTVTALRGVDVEVQPGEIFGLVGADGAGKTTFFRILTTLLLPDAGSATVDGLDVVKDYRKIRERIGYMPGKFSLYQDLTVEENLNFFATVFNTSIQENFELVREIWVQIEPFKKRRAGALSGGMKQKLALCCALIHRPTVLFLDEPTTGVDPVSRKELWDMLGRLKSQGISIVVSTPYMDEAERCGRIALIASGRILETGTPEEIAQGLPGNLWSVVASRLDKLIPVLRSHPDALSCFSFGDSVHFGTKSGSLDAPAITSWLRDSGHDEVEVTPIAPTVEDRFLALPAQGDAP